MRTIAMRRYFLVALIAAGCALTVAPAAMAQVDRIIDPNWSVPAPP